MATYGPVLLPAYLSGDVDFRTWCQGIHNSLIAVGLIQTADTGQINLSTVARPGVTNTAAGYEIFRLNDALQATIPIFIKIEYATGNPLTTPSLFMTTGSGSNGSGTLTFASARIQTRQGTPKVAGVLLPCYASGDGSRFSLAFSVEIVINTEHVGFIGVERSKDSAGIDTSNGWINFSAYGSSDGSSIGRPGIANATGFSPGPCIPVTSGALNIPFIGPSISVGTMLYFIGIPCYGISLATIDATSSPGAGNTFTTVVLGATHIYLVLVQGTNGGLGRLNYVGNISNYVAMLWE